VKRKRQAMKIEKGDLVRARFWTTVSKGSRVENKLVTRTGIVLGTDKDWWVIKDHFDLHHHILSINGDGYGKPKILKKVFLSKREVSDYL
jgi:hypothetical protein